VTTPTSRLLSISIGLVFAAAQAAPTLAATASITSDSAALEEVIVTATKRSENVQNVPVAISVLTPTDLKAQGVFQSADLNAAIPNLNVSSAYGETQPNFTVRGIGVGTEYNSNAASPVGVYVDEVYQSFRASHGQQLFDMDQIEVVKGPQGTLYGRNTTGGAINFTTTKPAMGDTEGYATVGYGNFDRFNAEGAVDFTPIADQLGIRLAGTFVNSQAFVKNVTPSGPNWSAGPGVGDPRLSAITRANVNNNSGGAEIYGVRATMLYKPSSDLAITTKLYASQAYGGLDSPQSAGTGKSPDLPADAVTLLNSGFAGFPHALLPPTWSPSAQGLSALQIGNDQNGTALVKSQGIVVNVSYRINDSLKLVSISDFDASHYALEPTIDCDGTPYAVCAIGYESMSHSINQDIRLDYASGKNKLIVGVYYGDDTIVTHNTPHFYDFLNDVALGLGLPKSYWNPPGVGTDPLGLPTGLDAKQNYTQERKSVALYTEGSRELTDTVKLTVGARYTNDKFAYRDALTTFYDLTGAPRAYTVSDYAPGGQYSEYVIGVSEGSANALSRSDSSSAVTGRVILDWKVADNVLLYASASRGYRGGTYNGLAFQSAAQVYFVRPETVDAFEVGIKSRFLNNRLQFNGAAFHYNYNDQQQQLLSPSSTTFLVNLNGKMDGAEAELQFAATDTLRLNLGIGLLHSAYDHTHCPTEVIGLTPPQVGNCLATGAGNIDVGGNPFPYASNVTGNVGADWKAVQLAKGHVNVHVDATYTGRYYYDTFGNYSYTSATGGPGSGSVTARNIALGPLHNGNEPYTLINARVSYVSGDWTVAAWGKNLTDKIYYPNMINVEGSYGSDYRMRAAPRTFGIEVSRKF